MRLVTELYGAGLEHVVGVVVEADDEALTPAAMLRRIVDDELVGELARAARAPPARPARRVSSRRSTTSGPISRRTAATSSSSTSTKPPGVVRLRLVGSCDGCPSSSVTLQLAVEAAIHEAAPEIVSIVADGASEQPATNGTEVAVELSRKVAASHAGMGAGLRDQPPARGPARAPRPRGRRGRLLSIGRRALRLRRPVPGVRRCPPRRLARRRGAALPHVRAPPTTCASPVAASTGTHAHLEPVPLLDDGGIVKISLAAAAPA